MDIWFFLKHKMDWPKVATGGNIFSKIRTAVLEGVNYE
jgi:hypothetical protein